MYLGDKVDRIHSWWTANCKTYNVLILAAHCFFDDDKRKLFSAKKYEIAVGKIKRDYAIKDNSETAFYKVGINIFS